MTQRQKRLIGLILVVMIAMVAVFAACQEKITPVDVHGTYYAEVDGAQYVLNLDGNKFEFQTPAKTVKGTFLYDGTKLTLDEGAEISSLTLGEGLQSATVAYGGQTYNLAKTTLRTVTFKDGTATIATQILPDGQYASQNAPEKSDFAFVGWYADAAFKDPVNLATKRITADLTIYARYVAIDPSAKEYTASLYVDGQKTGEMQTTGGLLIGLEDAAKDGAKFLGWWISDYQDASKLTTRYVDQTLDQDVNLYAVWEETMPSLSVDGNKISWIGGTGNGPYTMKINYGGSTLVTRANLTNAAVDYDFAGAEAGDYVIEFSKGNDVVYAYHKNKALTRVSGFEVIDGGMKLTYGAVANAEKYLITITCGDENYNRVDLDNGNALFFDFTNYPIADYGFKFVVKAAADGYATSESAEFVYNRILPEVTGIAYDAANGNVTWEAVEGATAYNLKLTAGGQEIQATVEQNAYNVKNYTGAMTIEITPARANFNLPEAASYAFEKATIASPANVAIAGTTISWEAVDGAASYNVKIGDAVVNVAATSYELANLEAGTYAISVQAVAAEEANNSLYTDVISTKYMMMTELTYANGYVSWAPVLGVNGYTVSVNGGEAQTLDATQNSVAVIATQAGANQVKVTVRYAKDGEIVDGTYETIDVNAYEIEYDTTVAGIEVNKMYVAENASYTLPEANRTGYTLAGWYTAEGGPQGGGAAVTEPKATENTKLFAYWTNNIYDVTLITYFNRQELSTKVVQVVYDQAYDLGKAVVDSDEYAFWGWYSEPNGIGNVYSDYTGEGDAVWSIAAPVTMYSGWKAIYQFNYLSNSDTYAILKADGITLYSEITLPAYHQGENDEKPKLVSTVESAAFLNCTNLITINIPDTVTNIEPTAFKGASKIEAINLIPTVDKEPKYVSENGIVMKATYDENEVGKIVSKEIVVFPQGRTGELTLPSGLTSITADSGLAGSKITKLIVPTDVTYIGENAFKSCTSLVEVYFEEPADNSQEVAALTIASNAFASCSKLEKITLPARLEALVYGAVSTETKQEVKTAAAESLLVFYSCSALKYIYVNENNANYSSVEIMDVEDETIAIGSVLTNKAQNTILYSPRGIAGVYKIPNKIAEIAPFAFSTFGSITTYGDYSCNGDTNITKLIISKNVTKIGKYAFRQSTGMTELEFLGTATDLALEIDEYAFYGCTKLTEITLPANLKTMKGFAFGGTTNLKTVNVESVGDLDFETNAFTGNSLTSFYVTTLTLGAGVGNIANGIAGVFGPKVATLNVVGDNPNYSAKDGVLFNKDETSLVFFPLAYTFPNGQKGHYAVPDTVTTIGDNVFGYKTNLTSIYIPASVATIGNGAFQGCTNLASVEFEQGGNVELTFGQNAFYGCTGLLAISIPERTVSIGNQAFYNCSKLEEINLPASLSAIELAGAYDVKAFYQSTTGKLAAINVAAANANYASIDGVLYAKDANGVITELMYCPVQKSGKVEIPNTVNRIWKQAFYYQQAVNEVAIKEVEGAQAATNVVMGEQAFQYSKIGKIQVPAVEVIGERMFQSCTNLTEITIPYTVKQIQQYAFYYCTSLVEIKFEETPEGVEPVALEIEDGGQYSGAFYYCKALTTVPFPERTAYIGNYAFYADSALTNVTIPSSVTKIGANAFLECKSLASVTFGTDAEGKSKLEEIGNHAFDTTAIANVVLPEGLATIGDNAFDGKALAAIKSVSFPSTLTSIGAYAFEYQRELETATFAQNAEITEIKYYAFQYCTSLKTLELPAVKTLGYATFKENRALTSVTFGEGSEAITNGSSAASGAFANCKALASVTFPATMKSIGNYSFYADINLANVTFNTYAEGSANAGKAELTSIGNNAFGGTALKRVVLPDNADANATLTLGTAIFTGISEIEYLSIPASVAAIDGVFTGCGGVAEIAIDADNVNLKTDDGIVVTNKTGTSILAIVGQIKGDENGVYTIPSGIKAIANNLFMNQAAIKKVVIPATVETIGNYAFANCINLEDVEFAATQMTSIGNYAFYNTGLTSIALPKLTNTAVATGAYMFANCTKLASVDLGANTLLRDGMFYYCSALKKLDVPATVTNTAGGSIAKAPFAYSGLEEINFLGAPTTIGTYLFGRCENLKRVDISKFTKLANYMFAYTGIEEIELPVKLTAAGTYTYLFYFCSQLKNVTFASGTTALPNYTFHQCTALESFTVPASVTTLGTYVFNYCTALKNVTFEGNAIKEFSNYLFNNCTALESIVVPEGVTSFGTATFANCTALKNVTLPSTLTTLGSGTSAATAPFYKNTSLESITIPASVKTIPVYAFSGCDNLTEVNFAEGAQLTAIPNYMFQNCTSLESFDVPEGVTWLGNAAFAGCSALKSVTLPSTLVALGTDTTKTAITPGTSAATAPFYNCEALETVTIPASVTDIGVGTFSGCTALTSVVFPENPQFDKITNYMFQNCKSITAVNVPEGVAWLGQYAFAGCDLLETVTLPASMTKLGASSTTSGGTLGSSAAASPFVNCPNLKKITIPAAVDAMATYLFGTSGTTSISYMEEVEFADGSVLTTLPNYTFRSNAYVKKVTLPASITMLGTTATAAYTPFYDSALEEIVIEGDVNSAYSRPFSYCANLKKVTFAGTSAQATIHDQMFYDIASLEEVTLAPATTELGEYAFRGCAALATVNGLEHIAKFGKYSLAYTQIASANLAAATELGDGVFYNCDKLAEITLPQAVTELPAYLFRGCEALETINGLANVGKFGNYSLAYTPVKSIDLSLVDAENVGEYVFYSCKQLADVKLPIDMTAIPAGMFCHCEALESVTLPEGLTSIGSDAFIDCAFTTFEIPATVTEIGDNVFAGVPLTSLTVAEGNAYYKAANNVLYDADNAILYYPANDETAEIALPAGSTINPWAFNTAVIGKLTLPADMVELAPYAFRGATIGELVLPAGIETIGNYAFYGATVGKMVIPATVGAIGAYAFGGAFGDLQFADGIRWTALANNAFSGIAIEELTIPASIAEMDPFTSAEKSPFYQANIGKLIFADGGDLALIPNYTFANAEINVKEIVFGAGIQQIGTGTTTALSPFNYSPVEKVTILGNPTMATYLFSNCAALTEVTFGENPIIETLPVNMFYYCGALDSFEFPASITSLPNATLASIFYLTGIKHVTFAKDSVIEEIPDYALFSTSSSSSQPNLLESIEFAASIKKIGRYATGYQSKNLVSVTFQEGSQLESLSESFLYYASAIEEIVLPASLKTMEGKYTSGQYASYSGVFNNCESLKRVSFEEGSQLETIGLLTASTCPSLEYFEVPEGVKVIGTGTSSSGEAAFYNCKALKEIYIPNTVESIGYGAFYGCSALETVTFEEGSALSYIGTYAFYNCSALTAIDIPASVVEIGNSVFYGCKAMTSLTLHEGLAIIGSSAFSGCTAVESVTIPSTVRIVGGQNLFQSWTEDQTININMDEHLANVFLAGTAPTYNTKWYADAKVVYLGGND